MKLKIVAIVVAVLFPATLGGFILGALLVEDTPPQVTEQPPTPAKEQSAIREHIRQQPVVSYADVLPNSIPETNHDMEISVFPEAIMPTKPLQVPGQQVQTQQMPKQKAWEINALPFDMQKIDGRPVIAILIDDVGVAQSRTRKAIKMPAPMTMSFIPYGHNLAEHVANARAMGHEIMLHLPMEAKNPNLNPGDKALMTSLDGIELVDRILWNLKQFDGYMGVNNHMGSKFTADAEAMAIVLNEIKLRGLSFIDSVTASDTVGYKLASAMEIPTTTRDIFLDHDRTEEAIWKQLAKAEALAEEKGAVLAIGHPYKETIKVLTEWVKDAEKRGFVMVPASVILKIRNADLGEVARAVQN